MEQHPVPQNVTTFQFRLIGDMTLKQFGYLVGGAIGAYIMYKLPLPFFFTLPLAVTSAVAGFGLAFVPIEERPMDVWVLSFIKSIYNPTQYVWSRPKAEDPRREAPEKKQAAPATAPDRRGDILQNIFVPGPSTGVPPSTAPGVLTMSAPKKSMFERLSGLWAPKPKTAPPISMQATLPVQHMDFSSPPIVRPAPSVARELADTQLKESVLEEKLKKLTAELESKNAAESRVGELQAQLTELLAEQEKMMTELAKLRSQSGIPQAIPMSASTTTTQTPKVPTIQIIAPGRAVKVGLPRLTTFPNIVTGIVKDKDKNLLPGVLVTVKDKEGMPLRALKTNRLGQFAASTQLPNGTYFVEVEDPRLRFTFDRAQITLNGSIVPALEIFAKTEKEITRAKLEKELFGTTTHS
ncbi:MAG: PrgI family protein [Candidatus Gottesmanbacteria bacterium]|nr:PrgI family protein [Candidatus Gottesmanbacteria bacterium]